MFTAAALAMILNSLIFAVAATCLAHLIGTFVKKRNTISGIQVSVGLALSFISGCFVAPQYLDQGILNLAKFFPSYWFIDNNYKIATAAAAENSTIFTGEILKQLLIIAGFAVLYFLISQIYLGYKAHKKS